MLERVEVLSAQGGLLNLPLEDMDHGLMIDEITGLDPVKATITSSAFAQLDGSQYQSSRREERNITLKITMEPEWGVETVRDLRRRLYSHLMTKSPVELRFYDSVDPVVHIQGRVESFETNLFAADPQVDISIMCFDPDFYEPDPIVFTGATTSTGTETLVEYLGDVETGVLFTLRPNRNISAFSIYHRDPAGALRQFDFNGALVNGDVLRIQTISGHKYVRLTRGGVETSFLFGMSQQSNWIELQPGENFLRFYIPGAAVPFDLEYTRKFGGL